MLELVLNTDLENLKPIEFNYEMLYESLKNKMESYKDRIISENEIPEAKRDRADLAKLKDSISAERIRIKKQYMDPYNEFEKKLNELTELIKEPHAQIDAQIKEFENAKRKSKRDALIEFYRRNVQELESYLTFEKIYNMKWETATYKVIDITQEMLEIFSRVRSDLIAIKNMKLKHEIPVMSKYLEHLNLGEALTENAKMVMLEEKEKANTAPTIAPVAAKEEVMIIAAEERIEVNKDTGEVVERKEEDIRIIDFRVWTTTEKLKGLAEYMKNNDIKYGKVPENEGER